MTVLLGNAVLGRLAETVGWTLVHFTWQALVVGIVVCLLLRCVNRHRVRTRYAVCCVGLILLAVLPLVTAGYLSASVRSSFASDASKSSLKPPVRLDSQQLGNSIQTVTDAAQLAHSISVGQRTIAMTAGDRGPIDQANKVSQPWLLWLVVGWLCGVSFLLFRMVGGFIRIRSWRQSAFESNRKALVTTFDRLREHMQIRECVQLLESSQLAVPTVIDWLRPVVLVPSSILSGLTPMELESILAHELAHIRRHDYFVNLLQNVLETLLFFHPVVWWLSHQARIEREHCCDELAIQACGDPSTLALALTKIEESRLVDRRMVAATGGVLADRIRRILRKETGANVWPSGAALFFTLSAILAAVTASSVYAMDNPSNEPQAIAVFAPPSVTADEQDGSDQPDDESDKPDYATRMNQVGRKDAKTGKLKSVFSGVRLFEGDRQVSQDMIFSNVFNYSFISERVVKQLDVEFLGEIDFMDHAPSKAERFGPKVDLSVHQIIEPVGDRVVRPYLSDSVWIPGHLGFYGMNANKQHVFKIVRLSKIDLGIGPPLCDVNLLVLDDENSEFGVIGRDLTKQLSRETGRSVMFSADGEMWLQTKKSSSTNESAQRSAELPNIRVVEQDGGRTTRAVVDARRQSIEIQRYLLDMQDQIARDRGMQPGNWSTKFETLVSAIPGNWSPRDLESNEVMMNVPENTGLRIAFSGKHVEIQPKRDHVIVSVAGGQIDLIDQGGVIRARATPSGAVGRLVARVEVISDESVLTIKATHENNDPSQVHVRLRTETGAMDTDDVPHLGVRYKLELPKKERDRFRMRLSVRENLDRLRKELNANGGGQPDALSRKDSKATGFWSNFRSNLLLKHDGGESSWGPHAKTGSLRTRLTLLTKHPKVGDPLRFKLELKNFGDNAQTYDPQYYSAFRVLKVTNAETGESDESLGMTYQTSGGKVSLAAGETVTLWETEDAAELFMLDEGTYNVQVAAPQILGEILPESNELTVTVAAGIQTIPKRLMRAFAKIVPEGWKVSVGWQQRVYLEYQRTRDKRGSATIQLWTSDQALLASEVAPGTSLVRSFDGVGNVFLITSENVKTIWPDYAERLSEALKEVLHD
ncbi:MAG: M56 family metallopeptidase [Planctomycetota bacterium]